MGMKPPMNEPAATVRNAVNQQQKRVQQVRNAATKADLGTASTYKIVKGSVQKKFK